MSKIVFRIATVRRKLNILDEGTQIMVQIVAISKKVTNSVEEGGVTNK